jgi:hypothetical protein
MLKKFIQISFALLVAQMLLDQTNAQQVLKKRVFPDPEATDDKTQGLPTNTTVADKKHNNKKPTKKDDKSHVEPKPENEKTPVKPHPKPAPKPEHTNSTSTESFEPSKDGARDKPKETDANTSTDAHEAKKKKDVAEKEKKDPKVDKKAANHEKFAKIDKHFDPNTMPFNEG